MIRPIGRTELRVVFALVVTAVLPLLTATWLANQIVHQVSSAAFQPEFGSHLTRSLGVYKDLVTSMKRSMRSEAALIAGRPALREAAASGDGLDRALLEALTEHSELLSLEVTNIDAVGDDFYYGCATKRDCESPGDSTEYVCCFDKLTSEDTQCLGRCVQSNQCNANLDNSEAVCEELGIMP